MEEARPRFDTREPLLRHVCTVGELFHVEVTGLRSGIDKRPVDHAVRVLKHGIWSDVQGDRENHGGTFKAVYAYAEETRDAWAEVLGRPIGPGAFGENLVTSGIDTDETVLGTRWRIGNVLLEATAPRSPCRSFAAWMGEEDWARRFTDAGRSGSYFRVLEPGPLQAPAPIVVEHVPEHGVTIGEIFRGPTPAQATAIIDHALGTGTLLYEKVYLKALGVLRREGIERIVPDHLHSTGRGLGRVS
ncbi:MAG: MOSC domain-containing protein [Actinomycetaceae bacterium]